MKSSVIRLAFTDAGPYGSCTGNDNLLVEAIFVRNISIAVDIDRPSKSYRDLLRRELSIDPVYCTVCGEELSHAEKTLDAMGQNLTAHPAREATDTTDGNIAYWSCERCRTYFSDADGKQRITWSDIIIDATGEMPLRFTAVRSGSAVVIVGETLAHYTLSGAESGISSRSGCFQRRPRTAMRCSGAEKPLSRS